MSQFRYSKEARSALRKAVTSHALWDATRQTRGLSSASLDIDTLEQLAREFGIDPAAYGEAKGSRRRASSNGFAPKPRPHDMEAVKVAAYGLAEYLTDAQRDYLADIFADGAKNGFFLTDKQNEVARDMIRRAEVKRTEGKANEGQAASNEAKANEAAREHGSDTHGGFNTAGNDTADALAKLLKSLAGQAVNPEQIAAIVDSRIRAALEGIPTVRLEVKGTDGQARKVEGHKHPRFVDLLKASMARMANGFAPCIWIAGPAGSGKTHAGLMAAQALGRDFHLNGAIAMPHELLGFIDAAGKYHATPFRQAYEHGGVYMFDEVDASENGALLPLNPAIANGFCAFPDKTVQRHPDCIIVASANTWGLGATADYVGRSKIDAAFLSRFPVRISWDYDTALEVAISGNEGFARRVIAARERARAAGLKVIIDPRASQAGAALIANGMSDDDAARLTYLANLSAEQAAIVEGARA
jgi:cobaltochelatase CobS